MKTICVPQNPSAQEKLNFNRCSANELIELKINEEVFYKLFNAGFFERLSLLTHKNIDDFEDEFIDSPIALKKVLDSSIFERGRDEFELFDVIMKIKTLFESALRNKTGVYFYF